MKYYTPEEIAKMLKVHLSTVKKWLRTGDLKGVKMNRMNWGVTTKDLEDFLSTGRNY